MPPLITPSRTHAQARFLLCSSVLDGRCMLEKFLLHINFLDDFDRDPKNQSKETRDFSIMFMIDILLAIDKHVVRHRDIICCMLVLLILLGILWYFVGGVWRESPIPLNSS